MLYDHDWNPVFTSHPPVDKFDPETPFVLKAGMKLRQTCTWDNTTDTPLLFPHEMCVSFAYYYPDRGALQCSREDQGDMGGNSMLGAGSGGARGGAADPTPSTSCVKRGDVGNSQGVGTYCTPTGGECKAFPKAGLCLASVGQDLWGCTRLGCSADADCSDAAHCHHDPSGSACIPDRCESAPGAAGSGGSGGCGG